jgi:hypothetical protein
MITLRHNVQTGSGAHPATYPNGTGTLPLGLKPKRLEADHSPPTSVVMNVTAIPPIHIRFHVIVLNYVSKYKDKVTFFDILTLKMEATCPSEMSVSVFKILHR